MNPDDLKALLTNLKNDKLSVDDAMKHLKKLPYENLGFARVDHHRHIRQGFPEVIFCQGKSVEQIKQIIERILACNCNILATRAGAQIYEAVYELNDQAVYNEQAATITIEVNPQKKTKGHILIISAGTSDIPVAEEAQVTAEILGSRTKRLYDVGVAGIHRLLTQETKLIEARVIIVTAGMEGALASVVGGLVDKPIIAVPTSIGYGASLNGLAALFTMLNSCAAGIGVVNIDNGFGAACLAHRINILGEK